LRFHRAVDVAVTASLAFARIEVVFAPLVMAVGASAHAVTNTAPSTIAAVDFIDDSPSNCS
jgi:hypothetical protein